MSAKKREKTEYGDFQTPTDLTEKICVFLQAMGIEPNSLHLEGEEQEHYRWRSGIKHDCSKVMELYHTDVELKNGLGENVQIENTYIFPLLKSSNVASNKPKKNSRSVIVTQKIVGEDTQHIQKDAPKTWVYLKKHQDF